MQRQDVLKSAEATAVSGLSAALTAKREALHRRLHELGSVIVAYSGGVDSAYLAHAAYTVLGSGMLAILADSASLSRRHLRQAIDFAAAQSIPLMTVATAELASEDYARNDAARCFHCKDELFTVLERERAARGIAHLVYGLNADDTRDYRPGRQAAAAHAVLAPLAEVALTKQDVRALARAAALDLWNKPASACLSSRIEYGRRVTPEVLEQVERAEEALAALGLGRFRVRHHGLIARIEIAPEEMDSALSRERFQRIGAAVRAAGFQYAAVDCDGYRSGSMNEVLPLAVLTRQPAKLSVHHPETVTNHLEAAISDPEVAIHDPEAAISDPEAAINE